MKIQDAIRTHTVDSSKKATVAEVMIVALSKLIEDGDLIHIGVTTPLGHIAAALAKSKHAPRARFYALNVSGYQSDPFPLSLSFYEAMALQYGPGVRITDMYMHLEREEGCHFEPVIPVQMDKHGNANLSVIGTQERPKVRLPGVGGLDILPIMLTARIPFYTTRHSPRTFVESVDFITALGTARGSVPRSELIDRSSGGPRIVVTNLGVFDFQGENQTMRVQSLHSGVQPAEVVEATSFVIEGLDAGEIPTTEEPSSSDLDLIRNELDPLGMRELDFLPATDRRARLRQLLVEEQQLRGLI